MSIMKNILITFFGVAMILIAGFFWLNSYIYTEKQADAPQAERVTLSGTYMCLPLSDTATVSDDCAVGIQTVGGDYYAIDLGLMSQGAPSLTDGDMITASGVLTPVATLSTDYWQKYPIIGIFSVTDSLEVAEKIPEQELLATYEGLLPCASCEGIATVLKLSYDGVSTSSGTYSLTEVYEGEPDASPYLRTGTWDLITDAEASLYELKVEEGKILQYRITGEKTIRLVGEDGSAFSSDLPYDLQMIQNGREAVNAALDTDWTWKETIRQDGSTVTANNADAFVLTLRSDRRYMSTTDCNSVSGNFVIDEEVISLSPGVSTLMFCEGSQEAEYVKDLQLVTSLAVEGDSLRLILNRDAGTMVFVRK